MMKTRVLLAVCGVLAALCLVEWSVLRRLQAHLQDADARAYGAALVELSDRRGEVQRVLSWLDAFLRAPDGLGRPNGLCTDSGPDLEIVGTTLDSYLKDRVNGVSEVEARQRVSAVLRSPAPVSGSRSPATRSP